MRILWGLVGGYGVGGVILFFFNPEWAVASFPIKFFGIQITIPLLLILFLGSLLVLVLEALVATWSIESLKRQREQLQAQLYEKGIREIEQLTRIMESMFGEMEDTLLRAIERVEQQISLSKKGDEESA